MPREFTCSNLLYTFFFVQRQIALFQIYATEDGEARFIWDKIGVQVLVLGPQNYGRIDWTRYS